jgi:hypothetical protein
MIVHDLAQSWAGNPQLREDAARWTWFREALAQVAQRHTGGAPVIEAPEQLAAPFLAWCASVDAHADYEALDPVDFRHFAAGLLLRNLLAARAAEPGLAALFVLTLLQALRLQAGVPALKADEMGARGEAFRRGLRETVATDPDSVVACLDQLCGLEPQWGDAGLAASRPAMRRARAEQQQQQAAKRPPSPVVLVSSR